MSHLENDEYEWSKAEIIRIGERFERAQRTAELAIQAERLRGLRKAADHGGAVSEQAGLCLGPLPCIGKWGNMIPGECEILDPDSIFVRCNEKAWNF